MSTVSPAKEVATQTFTQSTTCKLEVHCSPFGISGLYIKLTENTHASTGTVGIGSTLARLTGSSEGNLYFNNPADLVNQKYKLYGLVEDGDILRIDFIKVFAEQANTTSAPAPPGEEVPDKPIENPEDEGYENPDLVFRGKVPAGKPDAVEPFIGIFSFEIPPSSS
ncbi:hypothetical protein WICPIJ_007882 [Wickerhamomyces pijperi]|uniref:Uncharacterized protein n=1 Tax=Wickerhamomyces pijperi TaxID=599730 RepID=A0A9P8PZS4_WICPI|nr:hypothetical protein WICPIJ_007882 [Wickerhamomyces pijperi]